MAILKLHMIVGKQRLHHKVQKKGEEQAGSDPFVARFDMKKSKRIHDEQSFPQKVQKKDQIVDEFHMYQCRYTVYIININKNIVKRNLIKDLFK